jgi:hypothetical protein
MIRERKYNGVTGLGMLGLFLALFLGAVAGLIESVRLGLGGAAVACGLVEGAVGMVEHALEQLAGRGVVELDPERRAAMVSNLLVVLCGGGHPQPVVNVGSLYH